MGTNKSLRGEARYKAVFNHIKQYIIDQELEPGSPLPPEGQLVDDLGVGRSSVREAVKALQSLGIIDVRHGNGLYVRELNFDSTLESLKFGMQFDAQTVAELLQIRIWLETSVIGEAVKRIRPGDLERLGAVLDKWEASIRAGRGFFELDEEFHHVLYAVLGNETLIRLFDAFWVSFASLENEAIPNSDPYRELETHRAILEAIRSRDADRARDQLLRHFESVQEWVREYIRLSAAEGRGRAR